MKFQIAVKIYISGEIVQKAVGFWVAVGKSCTNEISTHGNNTEQCKKRQQQAFLKTANRKRLI
jgi:hypothetical protein